MTDSKIINYIKTNLSKGFSLEQIRQSLFAQGWSNYDISQAANLAIQQRNYPNAPFQSTYQEPIKKSPALRIFLILLVILIAGSIFAFFSFNWKELISKTEPSVDKLTESGLIDCGSNLVCLIDASKNCKPAKVIYNTNSSNYMSSIRRKFLSGVLQTTSSYLEIKGLEANKCKFYIQIEKIDSKFSEDLIKKMLVHGETIEKVRQIEQETNKDEKSIEGFDGLCKFNTKDLTAMLDNWKTSAFLVENWDTGGCSGKIFGQQSGGESSTESILSFSSTDGTNILVTAPDGKRIGYTSDGEQIAEIEGGGILGEVWHGQIIVIIMPALVSTQKYQVSIATISATDFLTSTIYTDNIQNLPYDVEMTTEAKETVTIIENIDPVAGVITPIQSGKDIMPPKSVWDLGVIKNTTKNSITLVWTAPGDDGTYGTASSYDIRYSTSPITKLNWDLATKWQTSQKPQIAGMLERTTITGLSSGTTYYFALKAIDDTGNIASISNGAQATTLS